MFVRLFRGAGTGLFILILLAGAALWASAYFNPVTVSSSSVTEAMPLWNIVLSVMIKSYKVQVIVSFILMILIAMLLIRFNISEFFINHRTFFPGIMFVLLYSIFPGAMVYNAALPATILILAALWRMVASYRQSGVAYNFFDAALLISTASLFYANAIWFLLLVFVGLLLLRSPDLREITIAIAGALLPYAFLYAIWYLTNRDIIDLNVLIINNLFEEAPAFVWSRTAVILMVILIFNLIAGLYSVMTDMPTKKVKSRKTFFMILWLLAISVAVYFAVPSASVEIMAIAAIPSAFVISNYYVFARKLLIPEIMFSLLIVMIIIARIWQ